MASGESIGYEDFSAVHSTKISSTSSSFSNSCSSTGSPLNKFVSLWGIKDVEKELHLFYHNDIFEASDLLNRLPKFGALTDEQREYSEKLKDYLQDINLNTASAHIIRYLPDVFTTVLDNIMSRLTEELDVHVRRQIKDFIRELENLLYHRISEGNYTSIVAAFTSMCCLHSRICFHEGDQAIWTDLIGKTVSSRPDIRLYKDGVRSEHNYKSMLVAVVEDMTGIEHMERCQQILHQHDIQVNEEPWKDPDDLLQAELESTRLDDSPESDRYHGARTIKTHLSKKVLAQHAGGLLLDLHKYYKNTGTDKLAMLGVIVNGTMVTFTLLEISKCHFQKLERNEELKTDDQATVFYSRPYDIIYDEDRNILIDIFIGLNNIEFNK